MEQNYKNHPHIIFGFHRILFILLLIGSIGSVINLIKSLHSGNLYSASLIVLLFACTSYIYTYVRIFPLKAQDRAIRAEENFRFYLLTGKALPGELRLGQIIALRFASDGELPELVQRAVNENLSAKQIKQAIQNWKADHHRV